MWVVEEGRIQWEVGIAGVLGAGRRLAVERAGQAGPSTRSRLGRSATYGCDARRHLRRMHRQVLQRSGPGAAVEVAGVEVLQSEGVGEQKNISMVEQIGLH